MAFIVRVARSAAGKRNGRLSRVHPAALGAQVVDALIDRVNCDWDHAHVDDVIFGVVSQVGAQGANIGRSIVLNSNRLPLSVPGTTVDRQCGSSQQALHFAAQAVMSGTQDVVIAGGVECMSAVPMFSALPKELGPPNTAEVNARFSREVPFFSQFDGAEMLCSAYDIGRAELDEFAAASHAKAAAAQEAGRFDGEIVPIAGHNKAGDPVTHDSDEGVRPSTTAAKLGELQTLVEQGFCAPPDDFPSGRITAGNASQISDGASAILVANEEGLRKLGNPQPLARIHTLSLAASDPVMMLQAPIPATEKALARAGLRIGDIDLFEVNEAFASVPLAWLKATGADPAKLNVNGGACALGHPLGGTGTKLMTTLVSEMVRRKAKFGLQAICEGGGTANATIISCV